MNRDPIEKKLSEPIDWELFEKVVYEVLVNDDYPRLRRLGGRGDDGLDAVEERYYVDPAQKKTIIQVTSQRAQTSKVSDTLRKLRNAGYECELLVMVFRHPVEASVRRDIIKMGPTAGTALDVRDQDYLVAQLGKPHSTIFARYFGTTAQQVAALLERADPLTGDTDPLRHAMLASMGALVVGDRARLARTTLFDRTVLAAVAATGEEGATQDELIESVRSLMPEDPVDLQRLTAAVGRLKAEGQCRTSRNRIRATENAFAAVGAVLQECESLLTDLLNHVLEHCRRLPKFDQASAGYVQRNVQRALLQLFRGLGPGGDIADTERLLEDADYGIKALIGAELDSTTTKRVASALAAFFAAEENRGRLANYARTYASLVMRNVDPSGRRWQRSVLSRGCMALDTDAVLYLLVEDLPEHRSILAAVT
ncbi:MAG: hypothetical protein KDK08_02445, partial [Rhizobiaceae bacterium]|nr:hypothetical protein [Rhizobiaceae bacterium]